MKILHVVGSRAGFLRLSPVFRALRASGAAKQIIAFAGHRGDLAPQASFLSDLELPPPDLVLGVAAGSPAMQTGRALISLGAVVARQAPDWIFAVGDTDASLAAALVGRKNGTPVAHLEAGLREGDDSSPEEVNRFLTDRLSDALFTSDPAATEQLTQHEGIQPSRVHFVGNVVADAVDRLQERVGGLDLASRMGLERGSYLLALIRRHRNVQNPDRLEAFLRGLDGATFETGRPTLLVMEAEIAASVRRNRLENLTAPLEVVDSLGYVELLSLLGDAAAILTDARELQDAALLLGIPCVSGRIGAAPNPGTFRSGCLAAEVDELAEAVSEAMCSPRRPRRPDRWDGHAGERIARVALASEVLVTA